MGANTLTTLTPSRAVRRTNASCGRDNGLRNDVVNRERQRPAGYVVRARGAAARTQVGAAGRPLHLASRYVNGHQLRDAVPLPLPTLPRGSVSGAVARTVAGACAVAGNRTWMIQGAR